MDPNTTLEEIRRLVATIRVGYEVDPEPEGAPWPDLADELAAKVEDLDGWLTRGGGYPTAWLTPSR